MTDHATIRRDGCVAKLKVLADDTRLAVVRQLLKGPQHVNAMNATIDVDQSLLSHHLRVLRDAGVVESRRDGKAVLYRLSDAVLADRCSDESIDLGCCRLSFDP